VELLEGKVPVAPVNSIPQALKDPQLQALGMIIEYDHPSLGHIKQIGPPFSVSDYHPGFEPAPAMGVDTEQVLSKYAGFTTEEISTLRRKGTI
jgi:formyl-CoA transferase